MKKTFALSLLVLASALALSCAESETEATSAKCGDGLLAAAEACDGTNLGTRTCKTEGFASGTLACTSTCQPDTSKCCNDQCVNVGDTTCEGNVLRTCMQVTDKCRT